MAAGSIVVDLLMKTGAFETDTKRAAKALKKFEQDTIAVGKAVGAALAAATVGFAYMIKSQIDAADAASKLAQSAGVPIDVLTSLSFAADLSGVSSEQLGKAFGKLGLNMADAAKGTGEAGDAFAAMGIQVLDANGKLKASDQVLKEVAGKFASYEDGAGKSALAMKIFGKAGLSLIPMLNAGSDGLDEMQDEAKKFGVVLDTETGKAAEDFNDTLTRLGYVQKGFSQQIMQEMLKPLQDLASMFLDLVKNGDVAKVFVEGLLGAFKNLVLIGSNIAFVFQEIGREIGGAAAQAALFFSGEWGAAMSVGPEMRLNSENARKELDAFQARIEALGTTKTINAGGGRGFVNPAFVKPNTKKKAAPLIGDKETPAEIKAWNDKLNAAGLRSEQEYYKALVDLSDENAAMTLEIEVKSLADREAAYDLMMQQKFKAIDDEQDAAIETGQIVLQNMEDNARRTQKFTDDLGASFAGAFEDAIMGGKGLGDIMKLLIQDIIRMTARLLIVEPLMKSIMGGISGGGIVSSFLSIFGGARASGGDVMGGRSYLVGENGPEMFTPRTTGSITPNNGGSGGTIVQNINITTGIQQTVRAEIMSMMPQIANVAKSAVADAKLRGGSYASAMR